MLINKSFVESEIRKAVVDTTKLYKGKGPLFVKVNIEADIINIYIKEVMSNIEKLLFNKNEINELYVLWEKIKDTVLKELISNIYLKANLKCKMITSSTDFSKNYRLITLKICD